MDIDKKIASAAIILAIIFVGYITVIFHINLAECNARGYNHTRQTRSGELMCCTDKSLGDCFDENGNQILCNGEWCNESGS